MNTFVISSSTQLERKGGETYINIKQTLGECTKIFAKSQVHCQAIMVYGVTEHLCVYTTIVV